MSDEEQPKLMHGLNFNSLVGLIALAVIMWVGKTTVSNGDSLTKIETQFPYITASVTKLELIVAQLVTRAELEGRLAEGLAKMSAMDKRLMQLEFEKRKTEAP